MENQSTYEIQTVLSRLNRLEQVVARDRRQLTGNIIFSSGGGIHIPGKLTVGAGPLGGSGGSGTPITSGIPDQVTGASASGDADGQNVWINVTWVYPDTSVAPISQFEIRFKRTTDTDYQYLTTTNSDSYRINGLVSGAVYLIGIRSISTLGEVSDWVDIGGTSAGVDTVAPSQVTGLVVASATQSCLLTWDQVPELDLDQYRVQGNPTNSFSSPEVDIYVYANVVTIDTLLNNQIYYWRVAGVDKSGNQGTWSTTASATTQLIPSAYIDSLVASKITSGTITAQSITLSNSSASKIQSHDGLGFVIRGDGYAWFRNVSITGLGAGGFTVGSGGTSVWKVDASGNMWSGNDSFANAQFSASSLGTVIAKNIAISGTSTFGTTGSSSATFMRVSGNVIDFVTNATVRGQLLFAPTYGNGIALSAHATGGIGTQKSSLILGTNAYFTSGTDGDTFVGSLDGGSSGQTGNLYLSSATSVDFKSGTFRTAYFEQQAVANNGRLLITGAASGSEGGEVALLTATGGDNNVFLDNWLSGSDAYFRIHNSVAIIAKFKMDTTVYDHAVTGRAAYVNSGSTFGTLSSSIRYKRDVNPWTLPIKYWESTSKVSAKTFRYKSDINEEMDSEQLRFGMIAEELAEAFPELVFFDENGTPEGIAYEMVGVVLWELVKDLNERVLALEAS